MTRPSSTLPAQARSVVAAAADGNQELVVAAEIHRRDHISDIGAARDGQRPLVDHAVVEPARFLVIRMIPCDDCATERLAKFGESFFVH
jgi:hypothetical protein